MSDPLRFYTDLASWWPLVSPVEEYREEAAYLQTLLASAGIPVREVLELGSGGGHNAWHLRERFAMTLSDLSAEMIAVSRALNPDCEHHVADMRTLRLDRQFDAVFVHDAIEYMASRADLRAALVTAFVHCRPGGVAVFVPDATRESFAESTDCGGTDHPDGRGARYLEWTWDAIPDDEQIRTSYTLVLRDADGTIETVQEVHTLGLYSIDTWVGLLREVGFEPRVVVEETTEDHDPRTIFVGRRP